MILDELLRATPTRVFLVRFKGVHKDDGNVSLEEPFVTHAAAGTDHSFVVTSDGHAYSFGRNNNLQLGVGDGSPHSLLPRRIRLNAHVMRAAASSSHTLLVCAQGTVYAAGADDKCQSRAIGGTGGKSLKRFTPIQNLEKSVICRRFYSVSPKPKD